MTLANFKNRTRVITFFVFVIALSASSFYAGRITTSNKLTQSVKGESTVGNPSRDTIEKPQPYADEQKADVVASSVKICSNATFGFEISYPRDWFTTQNNDPQMCTFFAPYTFVVPQIVDTDIVPISVQVAKADTWQATVALYSEPNDFQNIDTVQTIEISGKPVTKVDSLSTGKNDIPRGYLKETYLIFDSKTPLIVSYTQLAQGDNIENFQGVLKSMVENIKLF